MSDVSEPTPRSDDATSPVEEADVGDDDSTSQQTLENQAATRESISAAENGAGRAAESDDPDSGWEPREHDLIPLLPRGTPLFDGMPSEAIILEALCPAIGSGGIIVRRPDAVGVVLVQDGALFEKYAFSGETRLIGDRALAEIKAWSDAAISAYRFDPLIVAVAPSLLRGDPLYSDLRLTWTDWDGLLTDLCSRDGSYVVELDTPKGRGVTCILDGRQVATYTDEHPEFGDGSLLGPLAATRRGTIWVRREPRIADEAAAERAASTGEGQNGGEVAGGGALPEHAGQAAPAGSAHGQEAGGLNDPSESGAEAPIGDRATPLRPAADVPAWPPPAAAGTADDMEPGGLPVESSPPWAGAFPAGEAGSPMPPPASVASGAFFQAPAPTAESQSPLASLAPDLKLIARNRLQRSSPRVESMIDEAVLESRPLDVVLTDIRGLVIRGVMQSTLDEVVDEMATRARRPLA